MNYFKSYLSFINDLSNIIDEPGMTDQGKIDSYFRRIVDFFESFDDYDIVISYDNTEYKSMNGNANDTDSEIREYPVMNLDTRVGSILCFYHKSFSEEINDLVRIISERISKVIERFTVKSKLQKMGQRYQNFFKQSGAIMLIIDTETGQIMDANETACKFYGFDYKEITSMFISDINTMKDEEIVDEMQRAKYRNKNMFEFKHRIADGSIRKVQVYSSPVIYNDKEVLYSIIYDITEQQEVLQKNMLNEKCLDSLVRIMQYSPKSELDLLRFAMDEVISLTKSNNGFIYSYDFDTKTLVFEVDTFNGQSSKNADIPLNQEKEHLIKNSCNIYNDSASQFLEGLGLNNITEDITNLLVYPFVIDNDVVIFCGVTNKNGGFTKLDLRHISVLIEILWMTLQQYKNNKILLTAMKKAEESDMLKSRFLANMSHEIRTPLNAIVGFCNLLVNQKRDEKTEKHFIDIIKSSSNQLLRIINDILDLSVIDSGQISIKRLDVNLHHVINELYDLFKIQLKDKDISLRYRTELSIDSDYNIYVDFYRLKQILNNLLENAVKFTKEGEIEFGYFKCDSNALVFYVKDSGIGIDKGKINEIVMPFRQDDESSTRKFGGAGLGLSISKSLIETMGGHLWFDESISGGSVFYFDLPCESADSVIENLSDKSALIEKFIDISILVLTKSVNHSYYFTRLFDDLGINVETCNNNHCAMDILKKRKADILIIENDNSNDTVNFLNNIRLRFPEITVRTFTFIDNPPINLSESRGEISYSVDFILPLSELELIEKL